GGWRQQTSSLPCVLGRFFSRTFAQLASCGLLSSCCIICSSLSPQYQVLILPLSLVSTQQASQGALGYFVNPGKYWLSCPQASSTSDSRHQNRSNDNKTST
ncbi:unnamed protein product, partial [Ectocarpus sp. 4 AP-2014]